MTSTMMTLLGIFAAMLSFLQIGMSNMHDIPPFLSLLVGTLNAGITFYLGQTNKGTAVQAVKTVEADNAVGNKVDKR